MSDLRGDRRQSTPDFGRVMDELPEGQPKKSVAAEARSGMSGRFSAGAMPAEQSKDFGAAIRRLLATLAPERFGAITVVLLSICSVTLMVIGPRLLGHATDVIVKGVLGRLHGGPGIDFGELHRRLLVVVALYGVAALLSWTQGLLLAGVVQRSMHRLRSQVEDRIHRLPLPWVDRQPRGDLLSRVTNDIDNIAQSLQQTLSQMLNSIFTIVGVVVMMFTISWLLALISLVIIPVSILLTRQITKRSKKRFIAQWAHTGTLNAQVEETFTGHALVTVFGRQATVQADFDDENERLFKAGFWAQFMSGTIQPLMMLLGNANYVAIAAIGGVKIASGSMTIGDMQAFIQYSRQFTQPLSQLASVVNVFQSGVASAERVFEFLDSPVEQADPPDAATPATSRGRVVFEHVSFRYDPEVPLIEDLNLVAEPGMTVAIVGPTGAGKTTLVNLIMRFYELDGGRITLDGVDTATMRRADLRSRIGMVLQDTWLFSGTIGDNIAWGNLDAGHDQLMAAARATYVDRFVHSLPEGYETRIDDDGTSVSAGEKQLLTIARAFLADPEILILDEATSSVDTRTEVLIQKAMSALRSSRTSFVIAHRLSTIRDADIIVVMEHGCIVEQGSHDELLAAGGAYARLYAAQFEGAVDEAVAGPAT
ncbi:MAG: ABC transporter ATP-binding protein [Microthrixaceae bacterium]